mmetsp:Transcript_55580/g.81696  ORF Transcript_55580/g.81696 Transcript_55580/m.81696 type:complete len:220 (+) Transcript_55580:440-1099(+)
MPVAITPHKPQHPCTGKASRGSSICSLRRSLEAPYTTNAPIIPMINACQLFTTAQLAVMDTSPARIPLRASPMSKYFSKKRAIKVIVRQPLEAEMVVVKATLAATFAALPDSTRVEPQLNPYHPNQSIIVPSAIMIWFEGGNVTGLPLTNLPLRGPSMIAPIRPATPPIICTQPEPAKSTMPREVSVPENNGNVLPSASGIAPHAERKPCPHTQCTAIG